MHIVSSLPHFFQPRNLGNAPKHKSRSFRDPKLFPSCTETGCVFFEPLFFPLSSRTRPGALQNLWGDPYQRRTTPTRAAGAHPDGAVSASFSPQRAGSETPRSQAPGVCLCFFYSVVQSRPFHLLVFPCWSIFSRGPKRLTFYLQSPLGK